MESNEAYVKIQSVLNLGAVTEFEQVIDIVLGKNSDKYQGNKVVDFMNIVSEWGAAEWKSVRTEYYNSFAKARLPKLFLKESQPELRLDIAIRSQQELAPYKNGPESYYIQNACDAVRKITPAEGRVDRHRLLVAMYVAMAAGENYVTLCYPPKVFLEKVVESNSSQDEFYFTLMNIFQERDSFESLVVAEAKSDPKLTKYMKGRYKEIFGGEHKEINVTETAKKAAKKAAKAAAVLQEAAPPPPPVSDYHVARRRPRYERERRDWGNRYDNYPRNMTRSRRLFLPKLSYIAVALCFINIPLKFWIANQSTKYAASYHGFFSALGTGILAYLGLVFAALCFLGSLITVYNQVSDGGLQMLAAVHPIVAMILPIIILVSMILSIVGSVSCIMSVVKVIMAAVTGVVSGTFSAVNVGGMASKSSGFVSKMMGNAFKSAAKSAVKKILPF